MPRAGLSPSAAAGPSVQWTKPARMIVDVLAPPPLLLADEKGSPLKLFIHEYVPMRNHILSRISPANAALSPMDATHVLLDLLPFTGNTHQDPDDEQAMFILHRQNRKVLCGYWAQECLRLGKVAPVDFWDLTGWDRTLQQRMRNREYSAGQAETQTDNGNTINATQPRPSGNKKRKRLFLQGKAPGLAASTPAPSHSILPPNGLPSPSSASSDLGKRRKERSVTEVDELDGRPPEPRLASSVLDEEPKPKKARKRRSKLHERSRKEQDSMWWYFLRMAADQLDRAIPTGAKPGRTDTVPARAEDEVFRMWTEARSKYNRRNLDHMSVMLATWETGRKYRLSPTAIRDYYVLRRDEIRDKVLPYASAATRPLDWPFHERAPQDIEATAFWIYDWGSQHCIRFMDADGQTTPRHTTDTADRASHPRGAVAVAECAEAVTPPPRRSSRLVYRSGPNANEEHAFAAVEIKEEVKIEWVYEEKPDIMTTEGDGEGEDDFMSISSYT